jgi:hypothetical protein
MAGFWNEIGRLWGSFSVSADVIQVTLLVMEATLRVGWDMGQI